MKAFVVLLALFGVALCNEQADMRYFLYENEKGEIKIEDLTGTPDLRASASDVTYHFYSQSNPTSAIVCTHNDISGLTNSAFSARKPNLFIIHGWTNSWESDVNSHIREYTLLYHDVNIFVVDWSPIAGKNYISAQGSVRQVGEYVADFIRSHLVNTHGVNLDDVKLVGHSLGAQIAGCAGAALNGQVGRIVGLDAAGPLFSTSNIANRLDPTDAKYVQGIHTNDGLLGFSGNYGHSDFRPNGGKSQPGCGLDLVGSCAHSRAYNYYAESLTISGFRGWRCDSYNLFTGGNCNNQPTSLMGEFTLDHTASGDYYLTTNSASPFPQG